MFSTLLASFWSNLSVFHEQMRITKKSKKYFFFEKKYTSQINLTPPPQTCWEHCLPNRQKKKKMRKNIRKRGMLIFLHPRSVRAKKNSQDP